jgi:hypothetical protein
MLAVTVKKIPDGRCAFESWALSTCIFEDEKSFETVNIETVECGFLFLKLFFFRSTPNFTVEYLSFMEFYSKCWGRISSSGMALISLWYTYLHNENVFKRCFKFEVRNAFV